MPVHYGDDAEVEVFTFWVDRLRREYREPLCEDLRDQELLFKRDQRLLRGNHEYYGRDLDELMKPRHKL